MITNHRSIQEYTYDYKDQKNYFSEDKNEFRTRRNNR